MAARGEVNSFSHLWQVPLLALSIALLATGVGLFFAGRTSPTLDQRLAAVDRLTEAQRHGEAIALLNDLLRRERRDASNRARLHLRIAETLDAAQRAMRLDIPANHRQIILQTRRAMQLGAPLTPEALDRMGDSLLALDLERDALAAYRAAVDATAGPRGWQVRKVVDLELRLREESTEATLRRYIGLRDVEDVDRVAAMGELSRLLIDQGREADAEATLRDAEALAREPLLRGEVAYRLGYVAFRKADIDEAERQLRVARQQIDLRNPLDADITYWLARVEQARGRADEARELHQHVLRSHLDVPIAVLARLGQGMARIMQGDVDAGMIDVHEAVTAVGRRASRRPLVPEMLTQLGEAGQRLAEAGSLHAALEVLALEQSLMEAPTPELFGRLAKLCEMRAAQLDAAGEPGASAMRTRAGDALQAMAGQIVLTDDAGRASALWRATQFYEQAGDSARMIRSLRAFADERPDDPRSSEALLRLGRAYQAAGLFQSAVDTLKENQLKYASYLAASKSAVPLAQSLMALGPEHDARAEAVLLGVVDNNPLLTPESAEYQQAVFELGQLYYRVGRYEEAVARMEEFASRYGGDPRLPHLQFLMAESYRKSARALESTPTPDAAEAARARRERLAQASLLYDRVIVAYRDRDPEAGIESLYLKLAQFYRADCAFDLGRYDEAIDLYDAAAFRYQDDPEALIAYVQIVNAHVRLGRLDEARTANERARWLLQRMAPDRFADAAAALGPEQWDRWLAWAGGSGLWQRP